MAAQELIDRMAAAYAAYNEGDAEPICRLFAADGVIRFVAPPEVYPFAAPRRGPGGVREAVALISEDYQWLSFRNLELIGEDDTVFALSGGRIRHRPSGRETVIQLADWVRFEGGQIVEFIEFFDTAGTHDWAAGTCLPACCHLNPGNRATASEAEEAARNKAALAEVYSAYRRKDAGPLIALLAEDACYNSVAGLQDFRFAGPCHGRDAWIENQARIAEDYELEKYDVLQMVAQDDLVAAHADVAFRDRRTGKLAGSEKIDLFRLRNGQILEFNEFFDSLAVRSAYEVE